MTVFHLSVALPSASVGCVRWAGKSLLGKRSQTSSLSRPGSVVPLRPNILRVTTASSDLLAYGPRWAGLRLSGQLTQ